MNPADRDTALLSALTPERWARANRELVAKILTEFMFEELFEPERVDGDDGEADFTWGVPGGAALRYRGRRRWLGHWRVDPGSIVWSVDGVDAALPDVADLTALAAPVLGIDPSTAAGAVSELAGTLVSDVLQLASGRPSAELIDLDGTALEGEMRGHPWIVANKGRIGFDLDDTLRYAPESKRPFALTWLAVAPDRADVRSVAGLDHTTVVRQQVGDDGYAELRRRAAAGGADPDTCVYLPVHPWQWASRIAVLHAGDIARRAIVPLGLMPQTYVAQQSIRTLTDAGHPERRSMKLPLSILNTSVYRGLPRARTLAAPALSDWFVGIAAADPYLVESGVVLLPEVASVSVSHPAFEAIAGVPYQHTEMLGAIWRDSVAGYLAAGERAFTMAALLHRDPWGVPFVAPLVERSGLSVSEWVDRLHQAVIPPLVHVLYRYGVTFSPHAQNCLVVVAGDVPTRLVVKDFVDDVMVSCEDLAELSAFPAEVRRAMDGGIESMLQTQWIQGGLFVCVYRYLSEVLEDHFGYSEARFWASATEVLRRYQDRFAAELGDRFALFDLDAPQFVKLCLNRVRVLERGYGDAADRPLASAVGWIDNPVALPEPVDAH